MSLLTVFGFVHKARAVFLYCFNIYMGKVIILKKTQIIVVNRKNLEFEEGSEKMGKRKRGATMTPLGLPAYQKTGLTLCRSMISCGVQISFVSSGKVQV